MRLHRSETNLKAAEGDAPGPRRDHRLLQTQNPQRLPKPRQRAAPRPRRPAASTRPSLPVIGTRSGNRCNIPADFDPRRRCRRPRPSARSRKVHSTCRNPVMYAVALSRAPGHVRTGTTIEAGAAAGGPQSTAKDRGIRSYARGSFQLPSRLTCHRPPGRHNARNEKPCDPVHAPDSENWNEILQRQKYKSEPGTRRKR